MKNRLFAFIIIVIVFLPIFAQSEGDSLNTNFEDKLGPFNIYVNPDPPEPINPKVPEYPIEYFNKPFLEGIVVLEALVSERGIIDSVKVLKSNLPNVFDEAAIAGIKSWKFQPGRSGVKPVASWVIIPIEFALDRKLTNVKITSNPKHAYIIVNNVYLGKTNKKIELGYGTYKLFLYKKGYPVIEKEISVSDTNNKFHFDLNDNKK